MNFENSLKLELAILHTKDWIRTKRKMIKSIVSSLWMKTKSVAETIKRKTLTAVESVRPWANILGVAVLQAARCLWATARLLSCVAAAAIGVGATMSAFALAIVLAVKFSAWTAVVAAIVGYILYRGTEQVVWALESETERFGQVMVAEVLSTAAVLAIAVTVQVAAIRDARQGIVDGNVLATTTEVVEPVTVPTTEPTAELLARRAKFLDLLQASIA